MRGDVADGAEEAGLAVGDHLGEAADVRGDHRDAAGHRLQRGQAEALGLAGQQEEVGAAQNVGQIDALAEALDVVARGRSEGRARSTCGRSGPSPTRRRRVVGERRADAAKTRTTSSTRLTGRKFETWTMTGGPRARRRRHGGGEAVGVDEVRDDVDGDGRAGTSSVA